MGRRSIIAAVDIAAVTVRERRLDGYHVDAGGAVHAVLGFVAVGAVPEFAGVGLAPSSCHERTKRLWAESVFRGAHSDVAPSVMGVGLEALLMIRLAKHESQTVDSFMHDVVAIPEVRSAFLISGRYDLVVQVVARDTTHLKNLALDQFISRPGVTRIETSIIFEAVHRHDLADLHAL